MWVAPPETPVPPASAGTDALHGCVVLEPLVQVSQHLRYLLAVRLGHIRIYEVNRQETHDLVCGKTSVRRGYVSL